MKIASVAEVKAQFSAYLKQSEEGPVIVTRNGKPVAALLAVRDEEELERFDPGQLGSPAVGPGEGASTDSSGEGLSHEDFWREVAQDEPGKRRGTGQKPRREPTSHRSRLPFKSRQAKDLDRGAGD